MPAAIASAALIVAGSLVIGQAVLSLGGRREWTLLAGPVGLAALLCVAAIVAGLGGRGTAIAVALGVVLAGASLRLVADRERAGLNAAAALAALLAALAASIPFIASGHVGILGVGLVNDDMASHLLLADWIGERFRPEPVLIDQGYPLGPHALVAAIGTVLHASSIDVFAGLTLAVPALTALVAYSALDGLRRAPRVGASALVALPYLAAAYLAQEAFKEPIMALLLLGFALLLAGARGWRDAIALGVIAAGVTYVYSFPGLAWLGGVALVWGALALVRGRPSTSSSRYAVETRRGAAMVVVGLAVLVVLMLPELGRLADFADFRALHPGSANEGGLGNLPGQLSPLEALGIWPTSEFRLSATASSIPAVLFYAGGLFSLTALALALPPWIRKNGPAIPAALLAAAVLYLLALALGTVYTSAKALAIAAPLIALITLGGLGGSQSRRLHLLAAAFALAAAGSSFLILRQAPVAPEAHAAELAEIRPLVAGEKLLFLGRDNFVLYELRGSKPFTHVRNFYDPYFLKPNFELREVGSKFDFDSVPAKTLARFPFVLTTRAAYASGPPPGYEIAKTTDSYVLWARGAADASARLPGETDAAPGRVGGCPAAKPSEVSSLATAPLAFPASAWSATTVESGDPSTIELDLPAGSWDLSLQYDATRALTVSGPGFSDELPGNLDYRGTAPYWPAGTIEAPGGPLTLTATVERPPLAGRLLGAHSVAHLGAMAAVRSGDPGSSTCGDYVDWFVR